MKHLFACLLCALPALSWAQETPKPSPYDSAHFSWRQPVPRTRLRELQPDRPGVTESPFTVDAGHAQVEVDGLRLINSGSGQDTRTRDLHVAYSNVKFGLSRRTDIQAEVPLYAIAKQQAASADAWQDRNSGFGDMAIRLKHNWLGNDQKVPVALATVAFVRLPTGGAVGNGAAEYGLIVPMNVGLSKKWTLEAQIESDLNYDREEAQHFLRLAPSLAFDYEFTKKLSLLAEGVTQWNSLQHQWQSSVNLAPIFNITENFQVDAGTHLALDRQIDHEYFVGFTLRR
ncbi:transporter [Hymenobacter sedentarius]|uniref:transporter n=1 Tax=Hymenobacter sedentarius TaxID=1411621 RepID=UPI0009E836E8|nr:transporter [Hymenobacter sedentarius]